VVEDEGKAKAFGLVEALLFMISTIALGEWKVALPCWKLYTNRTESPISDESRGFIVMKHLYPCDNNWGARDYRHADRVAKPLSS